MNNKSLKRVYIFNHASLHKRNREFFWYLRKYIPEIILFVPYKWKGSLGEKRSLKEKIKEKGIDIIPIPWVYFKNIQLQVFYPSFLTLLRIKRPQIIIFLEESFSLSTFEFSILIKDIPFVFYSAQNIFRKYPFPFSFFQKFVLKRAKGAFTLSKEAEEVLRKWNFKKNIFRWYLGVEKKIFEKAKPFPLLYKLKRPIFCYIGRLIKLKGVYVFLSAFEKFYSKYKKGTILFVGEGEEKENLLRECREKNLSYYFLRYVSHEKISSIYKSIDFLVLPSLTGKTWKEQFGRVIVEGMAAGVPVIGSDSGAIPEIIGDAGLIFKEGDSQDLFEKMEKIFLDENLRRELIEKGYKRVEENFTYEVIAKKLYEFLLYIIKDENLVQDK